MAIYNDLISNIPIGDYGNGVGTLTGLSQLWTGSSDNNRAYAVTADVSAPSGKKLTCTISTASTRTLLAIDAITSDANRGTCEILALVRSNMPPSGTAALGHGFAFNGSGTLTTETAQAIGLGRNGSGAHILRRQPYTAGSSGTASGGASITSTTGGASPVPFWIKINITPTTWRAAAYAQGGLDGTEVGITNSTHSLALGAIGLFSFNTSNIEYLYVSAGTGGDSAPRPSAAVPTGTTTITGVTPTSTTASVAWNYSAADQTGFEYRLNGGAAVSAGTSSPFNIAGLTASTTYNVEVRAINLNGGGAWSAPVEFTTSAAPAVPPTGLVTITGVTPSDVSASVVFTYSAADQTGFEYRLNGGAVLSAGSTSPLIILGLLASTNYSVEVRAVNAAGGGAWSTPSNFTTLSAATILAIDTVFDLSNISSVNSTVTNASSTEPTVLLMPRTQSMTLDGNWRNMVGKLTGCTGKRPIVRFDRSTQDTPTAPRSSLWRCYWTTDFVTFNAFPAADISSGASGYYQVQAVSAFTDDVVYVMTNPIYPMSQADTFATTLLTTYSTIASPTNYAVAAKLANPAWPTGAVFVSDPLNDYPTESGEAMSGVNLGSLPIYGFKLDWGTTQGATTDGGAKRKAVLVYGQHAQGEAQASISYFGALNWLLTSNDTQAINLRRNFVFFIYFNLNGSGIKGGHRRLSYGTGAANTNRAQDFNRVWDMGTPSVPEVRFARDAMLADTGGAANVLLDWHGKGDAIGDYNSIESSIFDTANNATWNALAATHFDMTNADIATVTDTGGYIINWANSALNVDYATHAEHANRGNNSKANLESVGISWLRTLQSADANGMFYEAPADVFNISISSNLPRLVSGVSLTSVVPSYNTSIASVLPRLNSNISLGLISPEYDIAITSTLPRVNSSVTLQSVVPAYTLGLVSTLPKPTSGVVLSSEFIPVFNTQVNSNLPKVTSVAAMTFTIPQYSTSLNSTLPKIGSVMSLNSQGLIYHIPSGNMVFIRLSNNIQIL